MNSYMQCNVMHLMYVLQMQQISFRLVNMRHKHHLVIIGINIQVIIPVLIAFIFQIVQH